MCVSIDFEDKDSTAGCVGAAELFYQQVEGRRAAV